VLAGELSQSFESEMLPEPGAEGTPQLFHFSQENARNVVEATTLRKQNFKLESDVRELSRKLSTFEISKDHEVKVLQQEIERLV